MPEPPSVTDAAWLINPNTWKRMEKNNLPCPSRVQEHLCYVQAVCACECACVCVCVCASQPLVLLVSSPSSACMWQCNFEGTACWISALKKWKSCWRKRKKSIGRCRGFGSTNNICCIKTKNLNPQLCLSEHEQQLRAHCWRFAATSAAELGSQRVVHFSECFVCYTKKKKSPCLWKEMPRIA